MEEGVPICSVVDCFGNTCKMAKKKQGAVRERRGKGQYYKVCNQYYTKANLQRTREHGMKDIHHLNL